MGNGLCSRPAYFNPRSPRGGATRSLKRGITSSVNFNPRSPRGGATVTKPVFDDNDVISIHAPHEGERPLQRTGEMMQVIISIHAPHEGERQTAPFEWRGEKIFQSTLPTRGSDYKDRTKYTAPTPISIHAPHEGERPAVSRAVIACSRISIHAPHEGERRISHGGYVLFFKISIHAPHEGERRQPLSARGRQKGHFNPRSPRGGATSTSLITTLLLLISIHAPHEGERLATHN